MIDRTHASPAQYRRHTRKPDEVNLVVLHQTGPTYRANDVRAHFLVMPEGDVLRLHDPLVRLRYGSRKWNGRCVTVEHAGNYPGRYTSKGKPVWWKPERGADRLEDHEAQVLASRALLRHLRATLPALRYVAAHRMIESGKGGCPGPDLWREIGEWSIRNLGLDLAVVRPTGSALPASWRREPTVVEAVDAADRTYAGPLTV